MLKGNINSQAIQYNTIQLKIFLGSINKCLKYLEIIKNNLG
jgi:hypothetical protein